MTEAEKCELCGNTIRASERAVVEDADSEDRYPAHRRCAKAAHAAYLRSRGAPPPPSGAEP